MRTFRGLFSPPSNDRLVLRYVPGSLSRHVSPSVPWIRTVMLTSTCAKDTFPQLVETRKNAADVEAEMQRLQTRSEFSKSSATRTSLSSASNPSGEPTSARFWYPTVCLSLDVKKPLPSEGVQWLFSRVRAKQIKNVRIDLEVIILDEQGDLVALSHHIALILGAERNMVKYEKKVKKSIRVSSRSLHAKAHETDSVPSRGYCMRR